jgi:poly(3-hydroxybutyrate) depolymerase
MMQLRYLAVLAACLAVAACQTTKAPQSVKETAVGVELPPMQEGEVPAVGYTAITQRPDGTQGKYEVVNVSDKTITWRNSEGCEWSQSREYARPFAPVVEWRNCDGSSGRATIEGRSGDPAWPLVVGKKWQYQATGYTGSGWDAGQECEVVGTVRITTVSGTHDTYKVVCTSKWARYTRYFSPALDAMVRYQRERLAGAATDDESELVRIEKPAGS